MKHESFALFPAKALLIALALAPALAPAAIVQVNDTDTNTYVAANYPCSSNDLINSGQPTLLSRVDEGYDVWAGSSPAMLHEGTVGDGAITSFAFDYTTNGPPASGTWTSTFALATSTEPLGFAITNVQAISGWTGNARRGMKFELLVSFVKDAGFVSLGTFSIPDPVAYNNASTRIALTDTSGAIARYVDAVRFNFLDPAPWGAAVYREVDVQGIGTANVPAPITSGAGRGPAGVGLADGAAPLQLWLKADALALPEGTVVTNWSDLSGRGMHVTNDTAAACQPTYRAGAVNGQPAVRFDGDDWFGRNQGYTMKETLVVATFTNATFTDYNGIVNTEPANSNYTYALHGWPGETKIGSVSFGMAHVRRNGASLAIVGGRADFAPLNEYWLGTFGEGVTVSPVMLAVGTMFASGGTYRCWRGDIAEVIVYTNTLNTVERTLIENHLAAKYGLTLDAAADKYTGDDPARGNYDLDVFGVGRTNAANQILENGMAGFGLLVLSAAGSDEDWILAGHKVPANSVAGVRWARSWYVSKANLEGDEPVALTFDWSDAGLGAPQPGFDKLWHRAGEGQPWSIVATADYAQGDAAVFLLSGAQFAEGCYTLGAAAPPSLLFYAR